MFGATPPPQNEETPFYPRSPYGVAKVYGYWITRNYREAYGMFAVNGILFNHESPRRGETFVTRKITRAVARIAAGLQETLYLGNLDAVRDWGYAPEYVEAMWRMLQADDPDDFVVATGTGYSVRDFVELRSRPPVSTGRSTSVRRALPAPVRGRRAIGDAAKAKAELGWEPRCSRPSWPASWSTPTDAARRRAVGRDGAPNASDALTPTNAELCGCHGNHKVPRCGEVGCGRPRCRRGTQQRGLTEP